MPSIANVELTHTFDTWRSRSNQGFTRINAFATNESSLYANTLTANVAFVSKGLAALQGRATVSTNLTVSGNTSTNKLTVTNSLTSSGNTTLGDSTADHISTTGTLAHSGRATVSTNLTVSGNTSTNKLTVTSSLTSSGNTTLGDSTADRISTTGTLAHSGRATVSTNLTVTGNTTTGYSGATQRFFGTTFTEGRLNATGNVAFTNTSGVHTVAGRVTLSKSLTVSGNTALSANVTMAGANVNITGTGKTLVKTANVDLRGGSLLVTSNTVVQATVDVANTIVARRGSPIKSVFTPNVYTLVIGDNGAYIRMSNTGGVTVKIPSNATVPFPIGAELVFIRAGGNNHIAFTNAVSSVTINSVGGNKRISQQYHAATIKKVGVNSWDLIGPLVS